MQKVVDPEAVMVGAGGKTFTVTTVAADDKLWHPLEFVTLTV
jgi:regulatory protein YycH of two-component signal transduction system YycFG